MGLDIAWIARSSRLVPFMLKLAPGVICHNLPHRLWMNGVLKRRHMKIRSDGASPILEDDTMAICIVEIWRAEGDRAMPLATE